MKHIIHTLSILICVVALVGCKDQMDSSQDIRNTEPNVSEANEPAAPESPAALPSPESTTTLPAGAFEIVGTITYKSIEGGLYAIDGDDGSRYDPIDLPESFRKDGLKVKVTARRRTDVMSLHMYGVIIEVVNIAAQ